MTQHRKEIKSFIRNIEKLSEPPIALIDHDSYVWAVGFLPLEMEIITGELNGAIKRYSKELKTYANQMCGIASRHLTGKEWNTFIGEHITYRKTCN